MGESERYMRKGHVLVSYADVFTAWKNWDEAGGTLKTFEAYLGRSTENPNNNQLWSVPPHIYRKIEMLKNPHGMTLMKVKRIRKRK